VVASVAEGLRVRLCWRPFAFPLPAALRTASGTLGVRRGWLLRLQTASGAIGWGEASPLVQNAEDEQALLACANVLRELGSTPPRAALEGGLPALPPPLAFALGAALAEVDGLVGPAAGGWRQAPPSAWLLPAGPEAIKRARGLLETRTVKGSPGEAGPGKDLLTLKWKVGVHPLAEELGWYRQLAALLPVQARLRLDANGGFDRSTAWRWAEALHGDPRLEWLEQPLDPSDQEGLEALATQVPVALDESLRRHPHLIQRWSGWQVRRPSQEGDPRPLLRELGSGRPWLMVSTGFETGVGQRWVAHLAALQAKGPTPVAPGLAPGWQAPGDWASPAPEVVWRAARPG
jgi:O-succinylbenzoate synthase